MKKLLLLVALATMAGGAVDALGFFKKLGQSMKESWNKAKESNPWPGTSSSSSSSSYSRSSSSTRQSKTNVKFGSVNTSESAGRWMPLKNFIENNNPQGTTDEQGGLSFTNTTKSSFTDVFFFSALRYPKSVKIPAQFDNPEYETNKANLLSYGWDHKPIYYQKSANDVVKEDNVFIYMNFSYTNPEVAIFRQKEKGEWIVWELMEEKTSFTLRKGDAELDNFIKQAQVFVSNSQLDEMKKILVMHRQQREVDKAIYGALFEMPNYSIKEKKVIGAADYDKGEPRAEILYQNGDSICIYYSSNGNYNKWYGRVHLLNGELIESIPNEKMHITYPDGSKYVGNISVSTMYRLNYNNDANALVNALKVGADGKQVGFTPAGGEYTSANGSSKHIESENERYFREQEEAAKAQRKKEEAAKQKEMQALYTKYGQKYVDALLNNGQILIGCPIGLLKDKCWVELSSNSGTQQVYHLYSQVSNYNRSGIIGDKRTDWTHTIWVRNGRVTSIRDYTK